MGYKSGTRDELGVETDVGVVGVQWRQELGAWMRSLSRSDARHEACLPCSEAGRRGGKSRR